VKTLIAVEDHATRSLLERAITSRLHRVKHAADFDTALKVCTDERLSLVILDWRLSTSRAPSLLEHIRARPDGDQLLVFAVLPPGSGDPRTALDAGANDYIPMPVDPRLVEWRLALAERQSGELTRRRRAEESVRQLDKAVATMQLGVTITDLEGTILFVNQAVASMHGYEAADELIWANASIFSEDPTIVPARPEPESLVRWSRERVSHRKDGSLFPVQLMSDVVRDAAGTPTAIVTCSEDITMRKRHEKLAALRLAVSTIFGASRAAGESVPELLALLTSETSAEAARLWRVEGRGAARLEHTSGARAAAKKPGPLVERALATAQTAASDAGIAFPVRRGAPVSRVLELAGLRSVEPELLAELEAVAAQLGEFLARREAEDALRVSEERFALAVSGANDGVWDWDLNAGALYVSPRWRRILGQDDVTPPPTPDEWLQKIHPEDRGRFASRLTAHLEGRSDSFECEYRMQHTSGAYRWVLTRGLAVRTPDGRATRLAGSQTDVTDRRGFDALTMLPNRALFMERVDLALARAGRSPDTRFAVLLLDLDRFKEVNDRLGHLAGDELLLAAARRLEDSVRPGDTVARIGGDEFAVLLDRIADPADAPRVADRMLLSLGRPLAVRGDELIPTASCGIALGAGRHTVSELLGEADSALYRAKRGGRSRAVMYDEEMREEERGRLTLQAELKGAAQRGELRLVYEPLVEPATRRVVSCRPLLLWNHPARGILALSQILPGAEESGVALVLDDWTLTTACRTMGRLSASAPSGHPAPTLTVPVSARSAARDDLAQRVDRALEAAHLSASALVLELPDEAILDGSRQEPLHALRARGVSLALGRFGSGTSSLAALAKTPLDAVSLDGALVSRLPGDASAGSLCRAAAAVVSSLGMALLASGVATEEQLRVVSALGCTAVSGPLFGDPFPEADAGAFVSRDAPQA
jgi:diguanylate cyclase (GGDEF)-like protein/PAS domain S-box-containing protein